jgi:hypothetical protein
MFEKIRHIDYIPIPWDSLAVQKFKDRGIDAKTLGDSFWGWIDPSTSRVHAPLFGPDMEPAATKSRALSLERASCLSDGSTRGKIMLSPAAFDAFSSPRWYWEKTATLVVVEGEMDFWKWSAGAIREEADPTGGGPFMLTQRSLIVIGVVGGSWSDEWTQRLPDAPIVALRTDCDAVGDAIAKEIAFSIIKGRPAASIHRKRGVGDECDMGEKLPITNPLQSCKPFRPVEVAPKHIRIPRRMECEAAEFGLDRARPWFLVAIAEGCEKILSCGVGARNKTAAEVAFRVGGHIWAVREDAAIISSAKDRLKAAAIQAGLPPREAESVIRRGLRDGQEEPLLAPTSRPFIPWPKTRKEKR